MNTGNSNFNRYVVTGGIIAALVLAATSFFLHYSYKQKFYATVYQKADQFAHTYLPYTFRKDSVQVARFKGEYVILAFWSDATGPSEAMLHQLAGFRQQYGNKLQVIAASIRMDSVHIRKFDDRTQYPFHYVYGNRLNSTIQLPGLPCFIVFDPSDSVVYVHAGYRNRSALDPVKKLLSGKL